jgi:hypothetical protein
MTHVYVPYRLWQGKQPVHSKNCGRLIHVSDFIAEETGQLVVCNDKGEVTCNAHKIIFPRSNGDPWWDAAQLLEQMKDAISVKDYWVKDCQAIKHVLLIFFSFSFSFLLQLQAHRKSWDFF